jgi:hypothetical protein
MRRFLILIVASLSVTFLLLGMSWRQETHEVRYSVTGTAEFVTVSYIDSEGKSTPERLRSVPWHETVRVPKGQFVYLQVKNAHGFGNMIGSIRVGGQLMEQAMEEDPTFVLGVDAVAGEGFPLEYAEH